MFDLMLPNIPTIPSIIQETIKRDTGNDMELEFIKGTDFYALYKNKETSRKYLVQTSRHFDLFGFMSFNGETLPIADAYIYIGMQYIFIFFGDALINDWKTSGKWDMKSEGLDKDHVWTSGFLLFDRIGGIIYDYKEGVLVERKVEE